MSSYPIKWENLPLQSFKKMKREFERERQGTIVENITLSDFARKLQDGSLVKEMEPEIKVHITNQIRQGVDKIEQAALQHAETMPLKYRAQARKWAKSWEIYQNDFSGEISVVNTSGLHSAFALGEWGLPPAHSVQKLVAEFNKG